MTGDDESFGVGYAKPPRHTRFRPGRSGNPAGRPRGPQTLARDLVEELQMEVTLGEGEDRRTLSKQRSILRGLIAKAIEGDPKATATVLDLAQRLIGAGPGQEPDSEHERDDPRERLAAKIAEISRRLIASGEIQGDDDSALNEPEGEPERDA